MTPHILDCPVWHSLNGSHARFAIKLGKARRFHPDIGPLAATESKDDEAIAALAMLMLPDAPLFTMQADPHPAPPGTHAERHVALQMVAASVIEEPSRAIDMVPLGAEDAIQMLELAILTEPGPFGVRTGELGQFWGVRIGGRLVAMAGERLRVEGFSEVSGVCAHPDFRGQGLARALMLRVMAQIRARGETPFLTTYAHNAGAIALYEKIGFRTRREMTISVIRQQD